MRLPTMAPALEPDPVHGMQAWVDALQTRSQSPASWEHRVDNSRQARDANRCAPEYTLQ